MPLNFCHHQVHCLVLDDSEMAGVSFTMERLWYEDRLLSLGLIITAPHAYPFSFYPLSDFQRTCGL